MCIIFVSYRIVYTRFLVYLFFSVEWLIFLSVQAMKRTLFMRPVNTERIVVTLYHMPARVN